MKKSLIALAVAGTFAAPAFAASSNVDIYGVLNVGINLVDDNNDTNGDDNVQVTSYASRLGFKGSEDLGGGLSAIWQIESGFNADETSGTIGSRNTFVGLKGGFGTVVAGKHDTPMKALGRKVDNFGDTMADSRNILGAMDDSNGSNDWDLRTPNTIGYISPNFSGLTVFGAYVTDTDVSHTNDLDDNQYDAWSANAIYENGPLMVGGGYEQHNDWSFGEHIWRAVAGYSFGDAKIGGQYESTGSDDNDRERKAWGVFGNYKIGAVTLKANYLKANGEKDGYRDGAKQYTIGADYSMSKRTTAYALYAKLDNNRYGDFRLGVGGGTTDRTAGGPKGDDLSVFGIGLKHTF